MTAGRLVIITGLPGSGKTTLAIELAASHDAVRMCPDDWMVASGIDLFDEAARATIERCQRLVAFAHLRRGVDVIIEWGTWTRRERDDLRDEARAVGAAVELRLTHVSIDEQWRRIVDRDLEAAHGSRAIERHELDVWASTFEPPTDEEFATYDP